MLSFPPDDPTIPDCEGLYRRIHPTHLHEGRISSAAFYNHQDPDISVELASKASAYDTLSRIPGYIGVAELTAGQARRVEGVSGVVSDPLLLPRNDAHALIRKGVDVSENRWKKACKKLAGLAQWAIRPNC